ncbi:hypothetical protein BDZ45DRAFT_31228 [Acephala macrosclerotiorum]|nr:hypothetical protein BDZ45DRAFT_31228 [Acephala macrosclerotiorum]
MPKTNKPLTCTNASSMAAKRPSKGVSKVSAGRKTNNEEQSSFMKFPTELHIMVFNLLGPGTQRLLGATCSTLYRIYKQEYWEKDIVIGYNEDGFQGYSYKGNELSYASQYSDIIAQWLIHPFHQYYPCRRRAELSELKIKLKLRTMIAEQAQREGMSEFLPGWSTERQKIRIKPYGGGFLKH